MQWWDSTAVMYQVAQWLTYVALACGITGLFSWSWRPRLAIIAIVIAAAAIASAMFAWFRLAHLRELSSRP